MSEAALANGVSAAPETKQQEEYKMVSIGVVDKVTRHEVNLDEEEYQIIRPNGGNGSKVRQYDRPTANKYEQ